MSETTYKTVGVTDKNKILANDFKAQERDLMSFEINLERFKFIKETFTDKESDYYKKIVNEIPVIESRIIEVQSIISAIKSQISDKDLNAALETLE